jgi:hypothetical protein
MLSGKMTSFYEAIELHEDSWTAPLPGAPTFRTPVVCLFGGVESRAKNSKVAHEHMEHREHDEFILVQASEE